MMLALALAVPVRAECSHDFVHIRREPDCEHDGLVWQECSLCGYCIDFDTLPALGHTFGQWYVLEEPACSRNGLQARDCTVCGFQETAPEPPRGHVYEAYVNPPSCTAKGYTRYTCRACTNYYIAEYKEPLGHWYDDGVLIKEPTETALGRVRFTCNRCNETFLVTYAFRDIDSSSYYFTPVVWSVSRGITSGLDETHFGPDVLCNRAQVVTFLWRAAGKPVPVSTVNPFLDVPSGSFYEKAVLWAYETGITTGTDACHFSPDTPCNRAQVVTFLHRSNGCPEPDLTATFPDVPQGSFYHKAVLWAA